MRGVRRTQFRMPLFWEINQKQDASSQFDVAAAAIKYAVGLLLQDYNSQKCQRSGSRADNTLHTYWVQKKVGKAQGLEPQREFCSIALVKEEKAALGGSPFASAGVVWDAPR